MSSTMEKQRFKRKFTVQVNKRNIFCNTALELKILQLSLKRVRKILNSNATVIVFERH